MHYSILKTYPLFKIILCSFILSFSFFSQAQNCNLVNNPSFENYSSCPTRTTPNNTSHNEGLWLLNNWSPPTQGSSDFFHICNNTVGGITQGTVGVPINNFGYQIPRTGSGYGGLWAVYGGSYREYMTTSLRCPLVAGEKYKVRFYVSLAGDNGKDSGGSSKCGLDGLGAYLSNSAPSQGSATILPLTPQIVSTTIITDTLNWVVVEGVITAAGGEQFITIGNFTPTASISWQGIGGGACNVFGDYAYYFIDDVYVAHIPDNLPQDTFSFCVPTPVQLNVNQVCGDENLIWTPATGLSDPNIPNPVATPTVTTTYIVSNGCEADTVLIDLSGGITTTMDSTMISCPGACDGTATVTANGGSVPYSYSWSSGGTLATESGLCPGTYGVTVTDNSGCTAVDSVVITEPQPMVLDTSTTPSNCGGSNGSATVTIISGGSPIFTYSWNTSPVQTTATASNIPAGSYNVVVTDGNGCTENSTAVVTDNSTLNPNAGNDVSICEGSNTVLNASGGDTYSWSPSTGLSNANISTPIATPAVTTTYIVTVSNTAGCVGEDTVVVTVNPLPNVSADTDAAICIGDNINITASGAATYTWNNGVPSGAGPHSVSPTTTTTYTVTGTDVNGCVNTDDVTITVNPLPNVSADTDAAICIGENVNITGSGAVTYTWDNGPTTATQNVSPTTTTTYTVTGTDANGCVNTDDMTITVNSLPTVSADTDASICIGENVNITGSGAATYVWDNGPTTATQSVSPTTTTTYTVTGTDANGCVNTDDVTIIVNPLPNVSADTDASICIGEDIDITGSGAATYVWDNGPTTAIQNVAPTTTTTYTVTGTDANGCMNTDDVTIMVNPLPTITTNDVTVCKDDPITITANGGSTYTWVSLDGGLINSGGNTATPEVQTDDPGATADITRRYEVTGVDANGCENKDTATVTFEFICGPTVNATGDVICEGAVAQLNSNISNTTGVVSYAWTPTAGVSDPTNPNPTVTGLTVTTTYTVIITDDLGSDTTTADVIVNPLPVVIASLDTAICIGSSANVMASGASTYVWDNGLPATAGPHNVSPGVTTTYTVTGTDVNGCVNDSSVIITVNPLPTITTADEAVCWEDSVQVCAAGGSTYTWAALDGGLFDAGNSGACVYVEGDLSAPGADYTRQYEVTGTDVNGCVGIDTATVTYEAICGPSVVATGDTICINEPSASLTTVITNTTGVVTYAWTPITNLDDPTSPNPVFTPTTDGVFTYYVTITDDLGTDTDSTIIIVNPLPVVIASLDTAICIGASANVTASGAISYVWDNGLPATAGPHNVSPGVTTTYTVTGTDVNGCVNDSTVTITVNPLPIITTADNSVCKDDPITICAAAGVTYSWVSLDGGLINGSSTTACIDVETDNPTATADEVRRYEVTGTDANGCVNTAISTVTFNYICGLTIRATGDTICFGEVAQLTSDTSFVTGGVTYSWTPTAGLSDPTVANPTITGLAVTTVYQIIATDAIASDTATTTIYVNPLPVVVDQTETFCEDNQGSGTAAGKNLTIHQAAINNTPGMTFSWFSDPGLTIPVPTPTSVTVSNGQIFYVLVTNTATGCVDTATVTYTVNPLPVPDAGIDQAICIGDNATITASSTGANPIGFTWDNGLPATAGPHTVSPANTTTYTVTATDNNGCVNTDAMTITVNPLPVPDAGVNQTICIGENVTITATSTGANPIGYTWDNGLPATAGPHTVSPANTTTYTVTATDNNGCVNTDAMTITVNPLPTPDAGVNQTICLNSSTTIRAISGGTGPFSFVWDNGLPTGAGPHTVSPGVGTTTYHVVVTDANGCMNNDSVSVTVNPIPTINAGNDTTICAGQSATLNATGAGVGGTYQWKDLTTGLPLAAGASLLVQPTAANTCYEVTGIDAVGCFSTDVVCVTVEQAPVIGFNVPDVCHGTTSTFNNTTTGAATYVWDFGDGNSSNVFSPQHVYADTGTYTVTLTATSGAGCVSTITDSAKVKYVPVVNFDGINLRGCPPVNAIFTNQSDSLSLNFTYLWDFGDGTSSNSSDWVIYHTYTVVGSYAVKLTITSNGCTGEQERINYVTVHPVPEAHFTAEPSTTDIYDPTINFTDLSIGADLWLWDFGDSTTANDQHPTHVYTDTGTFTVWLRIENLFGCTDSAAKPVKIKDVYTFFAPNAFTPDGDGINDVFSPQGHAIDEDEYTLYIFDRWGELIHETHDYYEGWNGTVNGTLVQIDVYVWKVDLKDIYGVNHKYTGRVSVIR